MKALLRTTFAPVVLLMVGAISVHGLIPDDPDGDGVPLPQDLCPIENASGFDRNGDGCIDDGAGARHIEYWGVADNTVAYVINDQGAPGVAGDSDLNAIQAAFNAWTFTPGTELTASYGGTTPLAVASGMDGVNLVTFADNSYPFGYSTLAVGLTTSFETPTEVDGRLYRPGEIFDADMIFNPLFVFGTAPSSGVQDIQSVATHEAGHLLGLSHTAVRTSTMYFVLPPGINARSLASDDVAAYRKAYGSTATMTASSRLEGTVTNGQGSAPVGGAIVYAINEATEDTTACDFTLADGSFTFVGLADGDYFVAIRPLDGTSPIDFMTAGNINVLLAGIVETDFQAESYDAAESNTDDASARTAVSVSAGNTTTVAIVTNIDATPPGVVDVNPPDATTNAAIDGAYVIEFSERIESSTIGSSFTFSSDAGNVAGSVAVIRDDSVLVFTPSTPLDFSTAYELRIDTDLEDLAGNALASDFVMGITTEAEPPLSISSLAPNSGVVGNSVVINGHGFVAGASPPTVTFNGTPATVMSFGPNYILAVVPEAAGTGDVVVTNGNLETSNALVFTVLSEQEIARGYETGTVPLFSAPNAIALSPDGDYAYIAVTGGIEAVVINPAGDYLSHALIQEAGEFADLATTPDGGRAYAVNATSGDIVEIMTDPTAGLLFNTILASRNLGATPRGIVVDPFGYRAYVSTDEADIQVWDIRLGSPTYQQQVGVLDAPDGIGLAGEMAIPPAGDRLLALANSGELFVYSLGPNTLTDRIDINPNPRHLVIDPQGQRAYVADDNGNLSVVSIAGTPFFVQDIATGGSLRGLDTTPAGQYLYATDRQLDNMKIVDLDQTHGTFRSVIENTPQVSNPADVAISNDGVYAFSVLQGDGAAAPRMAVTTIGLGPALFSMYPAAGAPGSKIVLTLGFVGEDVGTFVVDFNGTTTVAEQLNLTMIIATVPIGATSGPVTVTFTADLEPVGKSSNPMQFTVLGESSPNNIRFAGTLQKDPTLTTCDYITPVIAFSPSGDYLYTACGGTNEVNVYDIRPGSPNFHQMIGSFGDPTLPGDAVHDIALTADGKVAFIAGGEFDPADPREVQTIFADPNDPRFLTRGPAVPGPNLTTPLVSTSPNNRTALLLVEDGAGTIMVMNTGNIAGGTPPSLADSTGLGAIVVDIVHHPSSRVAYVGVESGAIRLFDTDPASATYGLAVATYSTGLTKLWSLAVSADGTTLYAYGYFFTDLFPYLIASIDVSDPMHPGGQTECQTNLETIAPLDNESFRLAPQGDFGVRTLQNVGLFRHDADCSLSPGNVPALTATNLIEFAFTPDGSRVYAANQGAHELQVYDFAAAEALTIASGDAQQGVIDTTLPVPLRVRVTSSFPGTDLSGIPLTFSVVTGGGSIMTGGGPETTTIVATDNEGFAEVVLKMGPSLGAQSVSVIGTGLVGSPLTFSENANADPSTLPLSLAQVIPLDGASNISPTTALLATFSRAVDPTSITSASFYLRAAPAGEPLPATFGFTDSNRKVSVTPSAALDVATVYEVVLTSTVAASNGGGSLTNPGVSDFTTVASQPLHLASVWPPSSLVGVAVTLSGTGFDSNFAANTVLFNGVAATPFEGTSDVLRVLVPPTAVSGTVRVVTGAETSNSRAFAVLERSTSTIDDVVATIGTVNGAKSVALSGDGALCYTLGTDGDVVIPINLEEESTYPSIPVGDQPIAIVMNPEGTLAYVANFGSGSVSVIDVDPASLNFNHVVESINVGTNPLDLAISLDGDRLAVANAGSSDVSIVDTDNTSEAYHEVVATIGSANGSKSVAISGDGTLYIGTDNSILVLRASSGTAYEVTATIGTANGTKSMAISGDGTLLFALTDGGVVLVIDLQDGSPSENSVVATIGTANGSKSVAVSGDGTLLYLVQEDGDEVIIIAIDIIPGVGVGQPDGASSFTVQTHVVGTLETGADPSDVAIDPSGSGRVVVSNAGDRTLTVYGPGFGSVEAYFLVSPSTLNLKSKGTFVSGVIQVAPPHNVHEIDLSTVRVFDTVFAIPGKESFGDKTEDGIEDLTVFFCRAELIDALPENGEYFDVVVKGSVGDDEFEGTDVLRVLRPKVNQPGHKAGLAGGQPFTISWESPQGFHYDKVNVEWTSQRSNAHHDPDCTADDGDGIVSAMELDTEEDNVEITTDEWLTIAHDVSNTGSFVWNVPLDYYPDAFLRITLVSKGKKQGESIVPFIIEMPLPTRLKSFDVTMEDGTTVLRWETSYEAGMSGYDVVRSEQEKGRYDAVTQEMVRASGSTSGGVYEYRDETVSANRTYWYKLREVSDDGLGAEYGPYSVTYRVSNQLDQNVPNPFNPTTVIKYGIASDNPVSLVIYDVAGRKVRTLVNERQRADVYRITWDGSNDAGQRVASGVYFYKLVAGKFSQTKKMVLLK